ncbi:MULTISPECIES: acyl-CoA thioesterase [unclassified Campylobacter]|uniref:acyl-CoA thioesterase n=1 Tax=unclassified Campylobacter TaxID=2593542 RepID=UPI003D32883D
MIDFTYEVKVEFYDVDSMDVVYHGNYAKFLETTRCAFLSYLGYDYNSFRSDKIVLPVIKMEFKFIKPARFTDVLSVKLFVDDYVTTLNLRYEIYKDSELICKAKTVQAYVDYEKMITLFEIPTNFLNALRVKYEI